MQLGSAEHTRRRSASFSPYGHIYHITSSPLLVGVAYYGHVAYGVPLGLLVQRWEMSVRALRGALPVSRVVVLLLLGAALVGPMVDPNAARDDSLARPGQFQVAEEQLSPDWVRLRAVGPIVLKNGCAAPANLLLDGEFFTTLQSCEARTVTLSTPGVHQLAVRGSALRTRSSFVMIDPVSATP